MDKQQVAKKIAHGFVVAISSSWALMFFFIMGIVWLVAGFRLDFSESWKLDLHLVLAIITFVMVLLIQHTQHRETISMQLKLDELLKGAEGSSNKFINIQTESDDHLEQLEKETQQVKHSSTGDKTGNNRRLDSSKVSNA